MDNPLLRLPPLDPLRGFVATAQALSFTRAAKALCLTQSAISRQIQTLEEGLGVSLFVRGPRSLTLTPEGERLARLGIEPRGGTPQAFAQMTERDRARWKRIITERRITPD